VWREGVVLGQFDRGHVCEDEVTALGVRVLLRLAWVFYETGMTGIQEC
jgi:hypothetical protein